MAVEVEPGKSFFTVGEEARRCLVWARISSLARRNGARLLRKPVSSGPVTSASSVFNDLGTKC